MKFIVASKEDTASMNIRRFVVEDGDWRAFGRFEGEPVLRSGQDALLVTIEDTHLYYDDIDRKVSEALGLPMPELVIFLSRHKSGSGLRTLTVHPLGCYHKADYGGRDGHEGGAGNASDCGAAGARLSCNRGPHPGKCQHLHRA